MQNEGCHKLKHQMVTDDTIHIEKAVEKIIGKWEKAFFFFNPFANDKF